MTEETGTNSNRVSETIGVITQHIRANELGPGDRLPSENSLSRELNVSRSVIREAFRSLAAMRLINLSVGKRATVAQLDHGAMSLMIEHGVLTEQISVQQVYDVRRTIETRTVTLASLRRTDAEAQRIRQHAMEMMKHIEDADQVMENDLAFHMAIAQASRNPVFAMIVGAFQGVARQSWPIGWRSRSSFDARKENVQNHIDIADAIATGDPEKSARLMKLHFDDSTKVLLDAGLT
ncbi:FadR/GntR family transcriptional regulator [Marinovum sp. 2_MG-2023]|uniref:FadR/GntR family transcriptional regulator n=2 Tax=Bacteria TaxID=2 RepID=UPI001FCFE5CB|nr:MULTISPECIES: FadR/GntR family transcriptional regulator [Roseobacteraceae]MCJ7873227.1 FadR family transcriptional regulator [Phaeobacter sp. J2-8]MDO6729143.1 FadR/GntR family transcriptional regulator [Marinovum sp. 2_MG-2023]MDO6779230.1 FadR/GntR family transcriptional regulator [Marinovum sp. 1_MG-2023]